MPHSTKLLSYYNVEAARGLGCGLLKALTFETVSESSRLGWMVDGRDGQREHNPNYDIYRLLSWQTISLFLKNQNYGRYWSTGLLCLSKGMVFLLESAFVGRE